MEATELIASIFHTFTHFLPIKAVFAAPRVRLACLTSFIVVLGYAFPSLEPFASPLAQESPLVLAFYYNWYDLNTWQSGTVTDTPAEQYSSTDAGTISRQVSQAQGAGIDAFVVSWYGPQTTDNQTETNFRQLLDISAAQGFRAAADFETLGPFFPDKTSVVDALRALIADHAGHPAYLRFEGKPVIFFWRQQRFSVAEWQEIRVQVDPDHTTIWIAEGTDITFQNVFDGHHLYSVAWSLNVKNTLSDWGSRVRRFEQQNQTDRLWVATVMPGYDDTRTNRADAFSVDRRQGSFYRETWAAARESNADWIVITSFNEWVEGTAIEPSVTFGDLYLTITREEAAIFRAGTQAATHQENQTQPSVAPPVASEQVVEAPPTPSGPEITALEALRIRGGPGTDYPRLAGLARGQRAVVLGRSEDGEWWQISVDAPIAPEGTGWVSAEFASFSGDVASVPVVTPGIGQSDTEGTSTPTGTTPATEPPPTGTPVPTPPTTSVTLLPPWPGSILSTLTPSATPPAAATAPSSAVSPPPTPDARLHSPTVPAQDDLPVPLLQTGMVARDNRPRFLPLRATVAALLGLVVGAGAGRRRRTGAQRRIRP